MAYLKIKKHTYKYIQYPVVYQNHSQLVLNLCRAYFLFKNYAIYREYFLQKKSFMYRVHFLQNISSIYGRGFFIYKTCFKKFPQFTRTIFNWFSIFVEHTLCKFLYLLRIFSLEKILLLQSIFCFGILLLFIENIFFIK